MYDNLKEKLLTLGIFEDNQYLDKYVNLVNTNVCRLRETYLTQQHHIVPKCYFKLVDKDVDNTPANLVNLLHKDHVLAHYYICLATNHLLFRYFNELTITKCLYFRDFKLQDTYENDKNFIESLEMYQELKTECERIRGERLRGVSRDPEVVARISKSLKMVEHTDEWNMKISVALKGRYLSQEAIEKLSAAHIGRISVVKDGNQRYIYEEELDDFIKNGWTRGGITNREPWNKGRTKDTDSRVAAGAENMRKHKWTDEQRASRCGEGNPMYGKKHPPEVIERINKTKKENGTNIHTEVTRKKIGVTLKGYVTMTNGVVERHVYPDQVEEFLKQGFYYGQKPRTKKNKAGQF